MGCERGQNALKQPKMAHFAPQLFIQTFDFYETLQNGRSNRHEQKNSISDSEKILVHIPWGLWSKAPLLGLFSDLSKMPLFMTFYIVVINGAEFKFACFNT